MRPFTKGSGPGKDDDAKDGEGMYINIENSLRDGGGLGGTEAAYVVPHNFGNGRWQFHYFFHYGRSYFEHFNKQISQTYHEGDWEHVAVWIDTNSSVHDGLIAVRYFYHHQSCFLPAWRVPTVGGTHPNVTVARNSHGNYPMGVNPPVLSGFFAGLGRAKDQVNDHDEARRWDTYRTAVNVTYRPWYKYTGGWGQTGPTRARSGPRGPNIQRNANAVEMGAEQCPM